jgi:glutaredoxin
MSNLLTLYSRQGCHLCEDMATHLVRLKEELMFDLDTIDIDTSADLTARYNDQVPLLVQANKVLSMYFLDETAIRTALA